MATTHDHARKDAAQEELGYTPGIMDTTHHERTFNGFVKFLTWNVVAIAAVLIFLALANA